MKDLQVRKELKKLIDKINIKTEAITTCLKIFEKRIIKLEKK